MSSPPILPPDKRSQHQQVSLRGKSAREISRDALLQKVSHERELRNYNRRASAAALNIQRIWRRHYLMRQVARKLQEEWEEIVDRRDFRWTSGQICYQLLRPFIFFTTKLISMHQMFRTKDAAANNTIVCFKILLGSMNSSELVLNFCSLAFGTHEEKETWLYQAKELVCLCSFLLAQCHPGFHEEENMALATSLGMRLLISLTDPLVWKNFNSKQIEDVEDMLQRLLEYMVSRKSCFYMSLRKYILKLDDQTISPKKIHAWTNENLLITTSAITLALRPFHPKKLGIVGLNEVAAQAAAEEFFTFILSIPYLLQRLPTILKPPLKHECSLEPSLKILLISKEKVCAELLKVDCSNKSNIEGIPCVGWALANIVNLSTEDVSESGDSGHFTKGLDFKLYVDAVGCLADKFLDYLTTESVKNKEGDDCIDAGAGILETVQYDVEDNSACSRTTYKSYTDQLKAVNQQWHLRVLIAMVSKGGSHEATDKSTSTCSRNLRLIDVVFLYSYMLRIFSTLNPSIGPLSILNILSFTPGFLSLLWKELEGHIFGSTTCKFNNIELSKEHSSHSLKHASEKRQKWVTKDNGDKWVHVLNKITGKASGGESSDLGSNLLDENTVVDDTSDLWEIESLMPGCHSFSKNLSALLHVFCAAYAHLLLVLDDVEFYEKQVPFTLEQQLRISNVLNNIAYFSLISNGQSNKDLSDVTIRCLRLLYERDCRRRFCPTSLWIGPARKGRLPIAAAARAHEAAFTNLHTGDETCLKSSIITTIPHVFPFEERVQMFREFIKLDKVSRRAAGESDGLGLEIVVRRSHIVEDGFRQINCLGSKLKSGFNVSFISESGLPEVGLDYGGLSKEFLTDLAKSAFSSKSGLFIQSSTSDGLLVPNISAKFLDNGIEMIEFLGRIVGKALYEGILLDYSFSLTFVQKLLGYYSFVDELSTLDPELYRNLMYVKHYDGDVEDLCLDFTVTEEICGKKITTELRPGGKDIPVTNDNKLQYVYAISDYKLNRQMLPLANAFFRGLIDLISPPWLRLFNANEFNQLLSGGKHDFDVDDLRRNTRYTGGYSEGSRTVKLFWEVVKNFEPHDRCMLLKFVTSCSRAPLLGFKYLQPMFAIHKVACDTTLWAMIGGQDVDRLPSASTCYNTLKLPTYKRPTTLKTKLLYAINSNAGFELS